MAIYKWATAPTAIKIWILHDDYSAMRWPAPDGFHVPLNTEWQAVKTVWTTLWGGSSDWTNFWKALKLPFAGYRDLLSANVVQQGSGGFYWSSSRSNADASYYLYLSSSLLGLYNNGYRTYGSSVRCFKDTAVVPTNSWTKLYWTSIEAGGIFWSSNDGLISLSSDGTTWITIADKNLWATTVWNSWDTLSQNNCWKYYQRWNNYWFPRTWSVTTSSTQVDASTYWPWNYYSSSTFITYNWRWDTTDNWNLRWWVTWIVQAGTDIKKVYLGSTQVRPAIPATAISLDKSSIKLTTVGQTSQITATLTPSDSTSTITWSSSNTSIATVSQTWLVTCVTPWTATITATTDNWLSASCSIVWIQTTDDYTTTLTSWGTLANTTYFYWIKFTALKTWDIKKVCFLASRNYQWTLKISNWNCRNLLWNYTKRN